MKASTAYGKHGLWLPQKPAETELVLTNSVVNALERHFTAETPAVSACNGCSIPDD